METRTIITYGAYHKINKEIIRYRVDTDFSDESDVYYLSEYGDKIWELNSEEDVIAAINHPNSAWWQAFNCDFPIHDYKPEDIAITKITTIVEIIKENII